MPQGKEKSLPKMTEKTNKKATPRAAKTASKSVIALHCLCADAGAGVSENERALARALILWQMESGRWGLLWMVNDPYRRWVSEIMLQQTQVSVVQGYYARFLATFPTVHALAQARDEEVMTLWSGLGYYSRAANLLKAARRVEEDLHGVFPQDAKTLSKLPGIGPSTAAAIASFCSGEAAAIFDGNVKRVLSRVAASALPVNTAAGVSAIRAFAQRLIDGLCSDAGEEQKELSKRLLDHEKTLSPEARTPLAGRFNQALMDLGAMLCTRTKPACMLCPIRAWCRAAAEGRVDHFPVKTAARARGSRDMHLVLCRDGKGRVLLETRATRGIWPGLMCLPPLEALEDAERETLAQNEKQGRAQTTVLFHALTHVDLRIVIHKISVDSIDGSAPPLKAGSRGTAVFKSLTELERLPLPAPIKTHLESLK